MKEIRATVHCSATKNGESLSIETVRKWHIDKGWSDIGYHALIDVDGSLYHGRPLNKNGAHVEGDNDRNIGICLVGDTLFSIKQLDSLRYYLDSLVQLYNLKAHNIFCHYQFESARKQGKTCPNIPINNLLSWYIGNDRDAIKLYLI